MMGIKDKIKQTLEFIKNRVPRYKNTIIILNDIIDTLIVDNMDNDEVMKLFTCRSLESVTHMNPVIKDDIYKIMSIFHRTHLMLQLTPELLMPKKEIKCWSDKKISKMTDGIDAERRSEIKNHIKSLQQDDPHQMKPVNIGIVKQSYDLTPIEHDPNSGILKKVTCESHLPINVVMKGWSDKDRHILISFLSALENLSDYDKNQILEILSNPTL
jgi:hypothetical protein